MGLPHIVQQLDCNGMTGRASDLCAGAADTHLCFTSTFVMAALMTPAACLHSLHDNATVMAGQMLSCISTSSCSCSQQAQVIYTPCAGTSSTMSCSRCSSPAMSNNSASHDAGVVGFSTFLDADGITGCRWI